MKITVIGGGNIGTLLAGELAHRGHSLTVFTNRPQSWSREIEVCNEEGSPLFSGEISRITDDMATALSEAELIWLTVPAIAFQSTAEKMLPHVKPGQILCVVPGSGGAEFAFAPLLKKGVIFCGLQRVHSIARLKEYGKSVLMLGRKSEIQLAAIPAAKGEALGALLGELLELPCQVLPNYLCVTLTPSNPILHTARLCSMFAQYREGVSYPKNILFYEEWTDEASRLLFACDGELQELCKLIPLPLESVKSLKEHYESATPEALTEKIRSIRAFRGLTSPMKEASPGNWVPDFSSRYFTADFSFGLKILIELCKLFSLPCPYLTQVWEWYVSLVPAASEESFRPELGKEELLTLYR